MTTTSTFQGMDENSKPSSRVLNPPGGGSSNIFGVEPYAPRQQQRPAAPADESSNNTSRAPPAQAAQDNQPARARHQKQAINPITGEPLYPAQAKSQPAVTDEDKEGEGSSDDAGGSAGNVAQPKAGGEAAAASVTGAEQPSTRVSQPPGGRSTKLW